MKKIMSILVGLVIVAAAWVLTFGIPGQQAANVEAAAPERSVAGSPAAARPGSGLEGRATVVTIANVEHSPFVDVFRSVGTARAHASVNVETEVAGKVMQLHFGANQAVAAGDALVSLDDQVEQIQLRSAKASLSEARSALERYTTLRQSNSGVISEVTLIEAETQVEIAEATLAKAEYDLEQKTVRAPISGTLGLTDVEPGVYLGMSAEIVQITDHSSLTIEFGLPDRASGIVKIGQPVRLTTGSLPGRVFDGIVEGYDGRIDSTTRTIKVRAGIDNADGLMLPGMIFTVILAHENPSLPSVPANAITWSRNGASVWIVEDGVVRPDLVAIRNRQNDVVWLDADLPVGAQVVVEGVQKLRSGSRVTAAGDAD